MTNQSDRKKVVVIGGGAAGMMAAIQSAKNGNQTILIEKNEKLGKKLFITGKGRCNLTNACDTEELFQNIRSNPKFLYSSIYGFDNHATMEYFEHLGLEIKTERGKRVFPESDHSSDVLRCLQNELKRQKVSVRLNTKVLKILNEELALPESTTKEKKTPKFVQNKRVTGVKCSNNETILCDKVIVATGGLAYSNTGSTGDGFRFAKDCGHTIAPLHPALVPFHTEEKWCYDLMGLSLKNVSFSLMNGKKCLYEGFGELLFTHFGISGPLVLTASSYLTKDAFSESNGEEPVKPQFKQPLEAYIDLKPALSDEQLDSRLQKDFVRYQNRRLANAMDDLLPKKLIPIVIENAKIDPDKKVNVLTKEEREGLVRTLKHLPIHISGTRDYNEAIITSGGINVKEINPQTMESKLVKGLYFAGEVIDCDALTGGFNLQIAWSTGYCAANSDDM